MTSAVREFFEELGRARGEAAPRTPAGLEGTFRVDLEGEGSFHLRVTGGRVELGQPCEHPDCVLGMSEEDFVELVTGRRNLLTTFLQGRVQASGSLQLAEALHAMLRAREQCRREAQPEAQPEAPPRAHP